MLPVNPGRRCRHDFVFVFGVRFPPVHQMSLASSHHFVPLTCASSSDVQFLIKSASLHGDPIPVASCSPASPISDSGPTRTTDPVDRSMEDKPNDCKQTPLCISGGWRRAPDGEYREAALRMAHREVPTKPGQLKQPYGSNSTHLVAPPSCPLVLLMISA